MSPSLWSHSAPSLYILALKAILRSKMGNGFSQKSKFKKWVVCMIGNKEP